MRRSVQTKKSKYSPKRDGKRDVAKLHFIDTNKSLASEMQWEFDGFDEYHSHNNTGGEPLCDISFANEDYSP